jgi:uncharacterized membrane protein
MKWKLLVSIATALILICFAFVFVPRVNDPALLSLPFILWTGILATILLVVLTYLGAKYFPFKEEEEG